MVNGQQPPSSLSSSETNFITDVPSGAVTAYDLGATFCFSITYKTGTNAYTVPAGTQYVPGTILTVYNSGGTSLTFTLAGPSPAQAWVNGSSSTTPALLTNTATVFVSIFSNATSTRWLRIFTNAA